MKTFKDVAFQGDVSIVRAELLGITELPADAKEVVPKDEKVIVTHSETGHHHWIKKQEARMFETNNPNVCFLSVTETAMLMHDRVVDQHETINIPAGLYQINRQVEKRPSGWERVVD